MNLKRARSVWPVWLLLSLLAVSVAGWCEDSISVADSTGKPLGDLPIMVRGGERLIPLRTLVKMANWRDQQSDSTLSVTLTDRQVILRLGNVFARAAGRWVQMRLAPVLWDDSFWVPARNLNELFVGRVDLASSGLSLRLLPWSETISVFSKGRWLLDTIIVDAGHGGKDPGAPGPSGIQEKQITLDIARRLASLIEQKGLNAKLTRTGDQFISLQQRTHFANEAHGDLFLSIHCNSHHDKTVHGIETYFLKPAKTARAVDVAMRENSVVSLEEAAGDYRDLTQESYILLSMAASQNLRDSEMWAAETAKRTAGKTKLESRGVDQAGFYVLMGAQMPAVLVECGYLSNAADAKVLTSEKGRQAVAEALLNSILDIKTKLETSVSR